MILVQITMAKLYQDCKQLKRAELIYKRALDVFIRSVGINSDEAATVLCEMARLSLAQRKLRSAKLLHRRALNGIHAKRCSQELIDALLKLALAYREVGETNDAVAVYTQVRQLRVSTSDR